MVIQSLFPVIKKPGGSLLACGKAMVTALGLGWPDLVGFIRTKGRAFTPWLGSGFLLPLDKDARHPRCSWPHCGHAGPGLSRS